MKDAKLITIESHDVPRARAPPFIEVQILAFLDFKIRRGADWNNTLTDFYFTNSKFKSKCQKQK